MNKIDDRKLQKESLECKRALTKIKRERLEFEKAQAANEKKFWRSAAGTKVTALISFAVVLVSGSSVWISKIGKDREIQVSTIQRQLELEKIEAQQKREWDLNLVQFVLSNQKAILNASPQVQKVLARIIPNRLPEDISIALLEGLEQASPPPTRVIWSQARTKLETADTVEAKETAPVEVTPLSPGRLAFPGAVSLSADSQALLSGLRINGEPKYYSPSSLNVSGSGEFQTLVSTLNGSSEPKYQFSPAVRIDGLSAEPLANYLSVGPPNLSVRSDNSDVRLTDAFYKPTSISGPVLADFTKAPIDFSALTKTTDTVIVARLTPVITEPPSTSISGTIIDAETGLPIAQATIELRSPYFTLGSTIVTTDTLGRFRIEIPSASRYTFVGQLQLRVTGGGYRSTTRELGAVGSIPIAITSISLQRESSH